MSPIKLLKKAKTLIWILVNIHFRKKTPVIIFAPGRVGSMALYSNLMKAGLFVFKLEFTKIGSSSSAKFIKKYIFDQKKPAKIISIVRDPIDILVSYFFSKAASGHIKAAHRAWEAANIQDLQRSFVVDVLNTDRLGLHLYWYEKDFKEATNIDIFAYPFDQNEGFSVVPHETYPTLIFRTEMEDTNKAEIIKTFLNLSDFNLTRENTRSQKVDAALYRLFKDSLVLPSDILNKIYSSPYAKHFLTEKERLASVEKYTKARNESTVKSVV
ncbi:MAG: putative capsular polysaccharide synthesis family protein [Patescibacteria group bacterium]